MIKAFFLIFKPREAWERVVQARRSFAFIFGLYLLPMICLATAAEGWGLSRWGKWQPEYQRLKAFPIRTVITFEVIQALLFLAMVLVGALLLLKISQTFESRTSYLEAFTTMTYGFSPLFLAHLLNVFPTMHPVTAWAVGFLITIWILYQGIPQVMRPDPVHAFGLYLSLVFVVFLISAFAVGGTALYLLGMVDFKHSWLTHTFPGLLQ